MTPIHSILIISFVTWGGTGSSSSTVSIYDGMNQFSTKFRGVVTRHNRMARFLRILVLITIPWKPPRFEIQSHKLASSKWMSLYRAFGLNEV
jgi:hypothetical protein